MRRCVTRLVQHALSRCFASWTAEAARLGDALQALHQCIAHMLGRHTAACFNSWVAHAQLTAQQAELEATMRRVLCHLTNCHLARGMSSWRAVWEESRSTRASLRRVVGRMRHRGLTAGWTCWCEVASQQRIQLEVLSCSVERILRRTMLQALNTWRLASILALSELAVKRHCMTVLASEKR